MPLIVRLISHKYVINNALWILPATKIGFCDAFKKNGYRCFDFSLQEVHHLVFQIKNTIFVWKIDVEIKFFKVT